MDRRRGRALLRVADETPAPSPRPGLGGAGRKLRKRPCLSKLIVGCTNETSRPARTGDRRRLGRGSSGTATTPPMGRGCGCLETGTTTKRPCSSSPRSSRWAVSTPCCRPRGRARCHRQRDPAEHWPQRRAGRVGPVLGPAAGPEALGTGAAARLRRAAAHGARGGGCRKAVANSQHANAAR